MKKNRKQEKWAKWSLLTLAFAASIASFSTTLDGTRRIFPENLLTQAVAVILAFVVQVALILLPLLRVTFVSKLRLISASVAIGCCLLLSTSTSFLSYISNFTAEEAHVGRQYQAWSETREWASNLLVQTRSAASVVAAAEAERAAAVVGEITGKGELRSLVNPYLRLIVWDDAALPGVDRGKVIEGDGVRAQFLRDLAHEFEANQQSLGNSVQGLIELIHNLDSNRNASIESLHQAYFAARDLEESELLAKIVPDYREEHLQLLDEAVFAPVTVSIRWRKHFSDLSKMDPRALGFFILALVLDCFIVVFSGLASEEKTQPRKEGFGINQILGPIYGENVDEGMRKWVNACEENRIGDIDGGFHIVAIDGLGEKEDHRAERALSRAGVLCRRKMAGGELVPTLSASAYTELLRVIGLGH